MVKRIGESTPPIFRHFLILFVTVVILSVQYTLLFSIGFCEQLSLCLHHCAVSTMPTVCHSSSVPGWNTAARLYKEKANFWHAVWKQAESPSSGVLHQIKKSSRSRYKYEVRRLKHREEFIRCGCCSCLLQLQKLLAASTPC